MFFEETELSLELMGVFKISRKKNEQKNYTLRGYDSISIRLSGTGYFDTKEKSVIVNVGDILYLPKNEYFYQKTEGETIIAIHFLNYTFNKNNKIEVLRVEDYQYVEKLIQEMYSIWNEQEHGYRYRCISLFYELIYYLNNQTKKHISDTIVNKRFTIALDYIHTNFRTEQISVSKLSSLCAVSETYFRRMFKNIYKLSPSQYIINLKLQYACQLLTSQLYTINEVSEKSGFTDSKYFCRVFKKYIGTTPAKFRTIIPEKDWQ